MKNRSVKIISVILIMSLILPVSAIQAAAYGNKYDDLPEWGWFTEAALWCSENGYIIGMEENRFEPEHVLTRAMFVQILSKIAGVDTGGYAFVSYFEDVSGNDWFAGAVSWAVDNKITSGTGETTFSPDEPVTREQLAVFLYAYARMKGIEIVITKNLEGFTDRPEASLWAIRPLCWVVSERLLTGTSATTLSPGMTATRAQTAVIVKAFVER